MIPSPPTGQRLANTVFEPFLEGLDPTELYSPYIRSECVERLKPLIASNWSWNLLPSAPLVGYVTPERVRVWLNIFDPSAIGRFNSNGSNPYRSVLIGQFSDEGIGTRISCRIAISPTVLVGQLMALLAFMFLLGIATTASANMTARLITIALFIIFPVAMWTNAIRLRKRAVNDREQILNLFRDTLDTERANWPIAGPLLQKPN